MDPHFAEAHQEEDIVNVPFYFPQQALLQPLIPEPVLAESPSPEVKKLPTVRIVEEPASTSMRFRYECETSEGRSAGSIPGTRSTPQCRTFPTIEILGYTGTVCVMISCVTDEQPFSAHPHQLVGRDCQMGVFKAFMEIEPAKPFVVFNNLGIQCVKKRDVKDSLALRKRLRVGPCDASQPPARIKLNVLRLFFQVFLVSKSNGVEDQLTPLRPVVTRNTISDKKAMNDLIIHKLSHCSASVAGGQDMILLCDKVPKDDVKIQFYETQNGVVVWKEDAPFLPVNVHKQVAINFRTPKYKDQNIDQPVKVYIMLHNPKTKAKSKPRPFELRPLTADNAELKRKRVGGENECSCLLKKLQQTFRENPELLSSIIMSSGPQTSIKKEPQISQVTPQPPMTLQPQPTISPQNPSLSQMFPVPQNSSIPPQMSPVSQISPLPQMLPVTQYSPILQMSTVSQIRPLLPMLSVPQNSPIPQISPGSQISQLPSSIPQMLAVPQNSPIPQMSPVSQISPIPQMSPVSQVSPSSQMLPMSQTSPVPHILPVTQTPQFIPSMASLSQMQSVFSNVFAPGQSYLPSTSAASNIFPSNMESERFHSSFDDILMSTLIKGSLPDQDIDDALNMQIETMTDSFSKFMEIALKRTQE